MRAPEQYLWIHRRFKTARWENRRCTFNKLLLLFPSSIGHNNLMVFMAFFLRFFPSRISNYYRQKLNCRRYETLVSTKSK